MADMRAVGEVDRPETWDDTVLLDIASRSNTMRPNPAENDARSV